MDRMEALGRHVLAEIYECDTAILDSLKSVQNIMVGAAIAAGATVREVVFHKFCPQGVSGVVVIAESHLTIHTWPELGYAAVDVFTCGDTVDPWKACDYIVTHFGAGRVTASEAKRGFVNIADPVANPTAG